VTPTTHLGSLLGTDLCATLLAELTDNRAIASAPPAKLGPAPQKVALFPSELKRDAASEYLHSAYHDIPEDEPELIAQAVSCTRMMRRGRARAPTSLRLPDAVDKPKVRRIDIRKQSADTSDAKYRPTSQLAAFLIPEGLILAFGACLGSLGATRSSPEWWLSVALAVLGAVMLIGSAVRGGLERWRRPANGETVKSFQHHHGAERPLCADPQPHAGYH